MNQAERKQLEDVQHTLREALSLVDSMLKAEPPEEHEQLELDMLEEPTPPDAIERAANALLNKHGDLDYTNPRTQALIDAFTAAYDSPTSAKHVAARCGIDTGRINMDSRIAYVWSGILQTSARQLRFVPLLKYFLGDSSVRGFHNRVKNILRSTK